MGLCEEEGEVGGVLLVIGIPSGFAVGVFGWLGGGTVEVCFQGYVGKR